METLRDGKPYAHAPPVYMIFYLHIHVFLFIFPPLTSMEKGNPPLRASPPIYRPLLTLLTFLFMVIPHVTL